MSELDWEDAPAVEVPQAVVPKVRDWVGPAYEAWSALLFPPRRGTVIVGGCLFLPIYGFFVLLKFGIFALGIVGLLLVNVVWIVAELITYRHRRNRALRETWTRYMLDLHEQDPPASAA